MSITFAGRVLPTRKDGETVYVGSGANERRVYVEYWRKGRPGYNDPRTYDWEAIEVDYDPERDPVGYGASMEDAITDLLTQIEEREE